MIAPPRGMGGVREPDAGPGGSAIEGATGLVATGGASRGAAVSSGAAGERGQDAARWKMWNVSICAGC